jgi:signal transduction histidine kinase
MPYLLLAAALLSLAPQVAGPADDRQHQVLVVYTTRRDAQLALIGERELPRVLEDGLGRKLDYYAEFVDPARFPDPRYQTALSTFLRLKYIYHRFEAVIAIGDDAETFLAAHRDVLEGAPPIVFYGTSLDRPRPVNTTGIVGAVEFKPTVELAESLDPRLRHVYVVSGADATDGTAERQARAQLQGFDRPLDVTYFSGLPTRELEASLRALPAHSMVLYLMVDRDGAGEYFHPLEYLDRVTAASNAPVYSWVDSAMGHGIVGGHLKSQTAQIRAVAELTLRILRGESADAIPVASRALNEDEVDWRQIQRFGLSTAGLRPGTMLLFRELTPWERYRAYILTAVVLLFAQTALIAGLLLQRSRRWRAERSLFDSQARLRHSYQRIRDLGARLLHAQDRERSHIARELHDDVSQQLALIEMDVKLFGSGTGDAGGELLERVQAVARSVRDLSHRLHPAMLRLIGLVAALKGLQAEMAQAGVDVVFTHEDVPAALDPDVTVCLFRVAQEALQNAIKYSGARRISLVLRGGSGRLELTTADDGGGFDVEAAWGKGLGLVSMRERVEAIGGELHIQSALGAGTRVEVSVPVAAAQAATVAL